LHRTRLKLHLKLNNAHSYAIAIGYNFKVRAILQLWAGVRNQCCLVQD
jgi:hypothetical protein